VIAQVGHIKDALAGQPDEAEVPVHGLPSFVEADWALFARAFTRRRPCLLAEGDAQLLDDCRPVLEEEQHRLFEMLARHFPAA